MPDQPKKKLEEEHMEKSRLWINDMMDQGRVIKDLGPDPTRETSIYPDIISPYYRMVRSEIAARGYTNVVSVREGLH
ncbi:MAG: hypothetical protein SA339_07040 [Methanomassiliicoccus sp.]|nr:hypothetical protein [Methanomassiliicoccus sp.]